jgi:hypothetical protein
MRSFVIAVAFAAASLTAPLRAQQKAPEQGKASAEKAPEQSARGKRVAPLLCAGHGEGQQLCSNTVKKDSRCAWHISVMVVNGRPGDSVTGTCGNTTATCTVPAGKTSCTDDKDLGDKRTPFTCKGTTSGTYICATSDP